MEKENLLKIDRLA